MNLDDFLVSAADSAHRKGPQDTIVMSSRVRLARNIKDGAFPGWAKKPERVRVLEIIRPAVESLPEMKGAFSETMDNLSALDKTNLGGTPSRESRTRGEECGQWIGHQHG